MDFGTVLLWKCSGYLIAICKSELLAGNCFCQSDFISAISQGASSPKASPLRLASLPSQAWGWWHLGEELNDRSCPIGCCPNSPQRSSLLILGGGFQSRLPQFVMNSGLPRPLLPFAWITPCQKAWASPRKEGRTKRSRSPRTAGN